MIFLCGSSDGVGVQEGFGSFERGCGEYLGEDIGRICGTSDGENFDLASLYSIAAVVVTYVNVLRALTLLIDCSEGTSGSIVHEYWDRLSNNGEGAE